MDFEGLLNRFTAAVEAGDGGQLASLFTDDGVYHDTFYGEFKGRGAIEAMLEERFHGDAEKFLWDMHHPVCDGHTGYACWNFSYTSTQNGPAGKRVAVEGMACFEMEGELILRYTEKFDSGMALIQMDYAPERLAKLFRRWNEDNQTKPGLARHFKG